MAQKLCRMGGAEETPSRPLLSARATMGFASLNPSYGALLRRLARLHALHPRGAILELRDLPERVERRIGEEVRGRLHIGERDEHDAVGHGIILACGKLDGAATGR